MDVASWKLTPLHDGGSIKLRNAPDEMAGFICVTGEADRLYSGTLGRPYRLAVRTPPFHGGSRGSIPLRVAISSPVSRNPLFPCLRA